MSSLRISFDRGTLRVEGDASFVRDLPGILWDARTSCYRAPAYHYAPLLERARSAPFALCDGLAPGLSKALSPLRTPELRDYQEDAVTAWRGFGGRGIVALPTGAGKTRVAIAAISRVGVPTLVLCPTRALLADWERELGRWYGGPIGMVGDGSRRVEAVTVMTFESAYRGLDELGDRFGLLIVDEVHHFAGGLRAEALETCAAPLRLGLTATAPPRGSAGEEQLTALVGPVVCEVSVDALVGTHLAPMDVVTLSLELEPAERDEYERSYRPFAEQRRAFARVTPTGDWESFVRALYCSEAGRAALAGYHRASALASFNEPKRRMALALLERHRADKTLVFTAFTREAFALGRSALIPVVTGDIGRSERAEILERFRDGRYRAIVSARVLNEGIDVPDASVAVVTGGALGRREHVQRVGRVLRPGPEKRATIYELVTRGTLDDRRASARRRAHAPGR